jgi:hypothetical protein
VEPFFYHDVCSTHFHSSACSIYRSGLFWLQSETKVKAEGKHDLEAAYSADDDFVEVPETTAVPTAFPLAVIESNFLLPV